MTEPPKIEGLLPCPFCSSDKQRIGITYDRGHGGGPRGLKIYCPCSCGMEVDEYSNEWADLPDLLKAKWNRRF